MFRNVLLVIEGLVGMKVVIKGKKKGTEEKVKEKKKTTRKECTSANENYKVKNIWNVKI